MILPKKQLGNYREKENITSDWNRAATGYSVPLPKIT